MVYATMECEWDSSLSSIIPTHPGAVPWRRLHKTELLARLHAKFWCRSMEAEECVWRRTQLENEPMNVDVDEGTGGCNNTEDTEGEDDQIGRGCYVLRIGIPGIEQIWIRKDYIQLYNCCDDYLKSDRQDTTPLSVVITGQPGIGKSYWILYALRRRLAEGMPVIWYRASTRFLFVNEGVYETPKDFLSTDLNTRVWTLVDSDESSSRIPPDLAVHQTQHLNIFTTRPRSKQWKCLQKTTDCAVFIMNPWTRKEILQAAVVHGFTNSDHQRMNTTYDQFGPTPRICFDFLKCEAGLIQYEARSQAALESLSLKALRKMISNATWLNLSAKSHTLLLVKRVPEKRLREANRNVTNVLKYTYASVEPITHAVEVALLNQLRQEKQSHQFKFFSFLASVEGTRRTAGLVFKSMAHSRLQERIALDLFPMMKGESGGSDQGKVPQWHSTHGDVFMPPEFSIDIQPVRVITYPGSSLETIEPGAYYVPESENQDQVAFDSFIMANDILYIFQFSIVPNHSIEPEILCFFLRGSLPPRMEWRFVVVVPPRSKISCPQPQDNCLKGKVPNEIRLFSAVLKKPT